MKLEKIVGAKKISWRYDPVLLTDKYTIEYHINTFEYIAKQLFGHIDKCIFSFVEMYKKLKTNMPEIILMTENDKEITAKHLGRIAKKYGIIIQTCGTNGNYEKYGINKSGCVTLDTIGKANGVEFKNIKHKGMRYGCHCIESRDIGAYDTCLNGCRYCYANTSFDKAVKNFKLHNENSPLLIGSVQDKDIIYDGNQKSFLKTESYNQISLFIDDV